MIGDVVMNILKQYQEETKKIRSFLKEKGKGNFMYKRIGEKLSIDKMLVEKIIRALAVNNQGIFCCPYNVIFEV